MPEGGEGVEKRWRGERGTELRSGAMVKSVQEALLEG